MVEGIANMKKLRGVQAVLSEKTKEDTIKNFFKHLYLTTKRKRMENNLVNNTKNKRNFRMMRIIFNFWKKDSRNIKFFRKAMTRAQKRIQKLMQKGAFLSLKGHNAKNKVQIHISLY